MPERFTRPWCEVSAPMRRPLVAPVREERRVTGHRVYRDGREEYRPILRGGGAPLGET
jgi:hypothetical protein